MSYDVDPTHRHSSRSWFWERVMPLIPVLVVAAFFAWWYWPFGKLPVLHDPTAVPRSIAPRENLTPEEIVNIEVYEKAKKSVVFITTLSYRRDPLTQDVEELPEGTGSGFIWDPRGYVVTNFHVIQDARAAQVHMYDGKVLQARLVGAAPDKDLAVLRIDAPEDLTAIAVGTSKDIRVGQRAYALGNPFGVGLTFTEGVVSALDRRMKAVTGRPINGVIQTSAPINPGNSGGPLLDSSARLIGVNTAIYSPSGANAGIGFAIPVDTVNQVVPELIRDGKIDRPGLGVQLASAQAAKRLGIKSGVLITEVVPNGAAAKAGMQPTKVDARGRLLHLGDVLVALDDKPVASADDLFQLLAEHKVGDQVKLTVLRDGERLEIPVKLQAI
jgi:S1-C subfamily serine protease